MKTYLLVFITCFTVSLVLGPLVIYLSKKWKASQTILHYVKEHNNKEGTPTMGGFIFIIGIIASMVFFTSDYTLAILSIIVLLGYGILGFLDDFIKIKFKQNLGLKPYQKVIGQLGISALVAYFVFTSSLVGSEIYLPFTDILFDLKFFIIPLVILVFIALSNSVNLTDGLDGLAAGTSIAYLVGFVAILIISNQGENPNSAYYLEIQNLTYVGVGAIASLLAYLIFNGYPAKIFMGDTGSLALGGLLSAFAVFSRQELLVPFLGVMFVVSALSVVLQVLYFKKTRKRIFLMAPFHHHLQKKGMHENKIVIVYIIMTLLTSSLITVIYLYARG